MTYIFNSKIKKAQVTLCQPPSPLECYILLEWPFINVSLVYMYVTSLINEMFIMKVKLGYNEQLGTDQIY